MKKLIVLLVTFLMLVFCNATVSQAVTLNFDPGVLVGGQINVDVVISGLGDGEAPSLGSFDIDIGYDHTILGFDSYILGSYLGILGCEAQDISGGVTMLPDSVNIGELSWLTGTELDALQPSSFTLATLTFATSSLDTSSLAISSYVLSDVYGGNINVIPEPATLFLLGTGLAGLWFLRKKRMNRVSL